MPTIYKNGKRYGGTSDTAINVNYENTESKLESTTVQEAVDEVSEKIETLNTDVAENTTAIAENASAITQLNSDLSSHSHNDKYYTEKEIDSKISTINSDLSNKITKETAAISGIGFDETNDAYVTIHETKYSFPIGYSRQELSTELNKKQNSATAINTSNISSQSVKYATSAGSATNATNANTVNGHTIGFKGVESLSFSYPIIDNNNIACSTYCADKSKPLHSFAPGVHWINGYQKFPDLPTGFSNTHFMLLVGGNEGYVIQVAIGSSGLAYRAMTGAPSEWELINK